MRLRVFFSFEKCCEPLFTRLEVVRAQPSAKQLVAKPDAISVDDIGLAVIGDFPSLAAIEVKYFRQDVGRALAFNLGGASILLGRR